MIVFLAVIVGSIVIAMFLPLIDIIDHGVDPGTDSGFRRIEEFRIDGTRGSR